MDGHAKGGGALSAVAATKSPIIYIGTGEHFDDLEEFNPESFIRRLLGLGDIKGLMEKVQSQIGTTNHKKMMDNIKEGKFTYRDMRDQFVQVMQMGSFGQIATMLPGVSSNLFTKDKEKEATQKLQRYLNAMDSMTKKELDSMDEISESRMMRIAKGSGVHPAEVKSLMMQYD